jgi:neopullulanase
MLKHVLLFFFSFLVLCTVYAQQTASATMRMEPANWWLGLKHNEVEIMFHETGIRDKFVSMDKYPGVRMLKAYRMSSPNYLIVRVKIGESAKPGVLKFHFSDNKGESTVDFPLLERSKETKAQGVTSKDAIYLVFPDRFANGDPNNDNVPGMLQGLQRDSLLGRHGGDLLGIEKQLDYIAALGMTAIWLNPELENDQASASYHGYALTDHYRVDRRFGGNEALLSLTKAAHAKGLKMIRDYVPNHIGLNHYWMKDIPDSTWINQWPNFTRTTYRAPTLVDPYASAYDRKLFSDGWFDVSMPDVNQRHPRVAQYLLQSTIWWVEYAGFDDFRIDTYTYSDQDFMSWWCKEIRREYPKLNMFGEIWEHGVAVQGYFADNQPMGRFDSNLPSVVDFQVAFAIHELLNKEQGWTEGVARLYYVLAQDRFYQDPYKNVTFLDNHDFSRFYTIVKEDFEKYKMGVALLATLRGTPQVYYATEILGTGDEWPSHGNIRKDFPGGWPGDKDNKFTRAGRTEKENEAWDYMAKLFNYRKNSSTITTGKMMQFVPVDGVYVFFRYDQAGTVMTAINTSKKEQKLDLQRYAERIGTRKACTEIVTGKTMLLEDIVLKPGGSLVAEVN